MVRSLSAETITLQLGSPFVISHGTSTARQNVLVCLRLGQNEGVGEAALAPYYGITPADVSAYVNQLDLNALLAELEENWTLQATLDRLPPGPGPARAAVDMALHDWWGRQLGYPLYQLWGLSPAHAPLSSLTIGIQQSLDALRHRLRQTQEFPVIKLKLGTGDLAADEAMVRVAREETTARLCVDANSAWSLAEAVQVIPRLAAYDLDFVEQPLPEHAGDDWHRLHQRLPAGSPPIIADESVKGPADVLALAGSVDGVNIKLAKAGGIREAQRMITLARGMGIKVMLGCMVESSVGLTAAAHLAPLVDWADLDGNLDVVNDPYSGARMSQGRLALPPVPGLGVTRRLDA